MGKLTNLNDLSAQYLPVNPIVLEFGHGDVNVIDFHVKPSSPGIDYDVRFLASNGVSQNGQGTLALQAKLFNLLCSVAIGGGGAQIARLLMVPTFFDLPSIAPGGIYDVYISVPGAQIGDVALFCPTADLYNGLWAMNIQASITNTNVARLYFHNLFTASVDVAPFSGKLIVLGFG
jgi:hypothetical protein